MDRLWNFSSIVLGRHLRIVFVGQLQLFQQWLGQAIIRLHLLLFLSWWKDAHKFKEKSRRQIITLFRSRDHCVHESKVRAYKLSRSLKWEAADRQPPRTGQRRPQIARVARYGPAQANP